MTSPERLPDGIAELVGSRETMTAAVELVRAVYLNGKLADRGISDTIGQIPTLRLVAGLASEPTIAGAAIYDLVTIAAALGRAMDQNDERFSFAHWLGLLSAKIEDGSFPATTP